MSKQHGKPKLPSNKLIQKKEVAKLFIQTKDNITYLGPMHASNLKNCSVEELRQRAKQLRKRVTQKQSQVMNAQKIYRMEVFKNQTLKNRVIQSDKFCQDKRREFAARLINQYKNNKDSPLFYNENGLTPFELMLLHYDRYENYEEHICMICYVDIQSNSQIVVLPCKHFFHRECAVSNLLYSKVCAACGKETSFDLAKVQQGKMKQ